ncbi:translation initiation factor IF-2-like [Prionailurus bengalensis]|uniref:translation initiation factor IF-2-like n=1 Tax=Prionailurus bengalensis TaxID=37029 RepID=UPI001CA7D712|nr:translation initiation factor IF-2-like [Prionailurus bengalensis]
MTSALQLSKGQSHLTYQQQSEPRPATCAGPTWGPQALPVSLSRPAGLRTPPPHRTPGRPQPILPPNSISLFHSPSPSSAPRPTRPGRPRGRGRASAAAPDPPGPQRPSPGREAVPAAGARRALGSPGASGGPGGRGCGRRGLLTGSWRSVVAGAPPGLRSRTRPRRASLPRDLARRGEPGAHSSRRRRRRCCFATLAAILTQPLSLPPPRARLGRPRLRRLRRRLLLLPEGWETDSLRWPSAAPTSAKLPGSPHARSPLGLPSAWRRRSPRAETGAPPGRTQRAAIAHSGRERPPPAGPPAGRSPRARGLPPPEAWEREGPMAMPRALRPLRGRTRRRPPARAPGCRKGSQVPSAGSQRGAHRPPQDTCQGCGCNSQRDFPDRSGDADLSMMFLNLKSHSSEEPVALTTTKCALSA